jgi:hypothetical protein
MENQTDEPTNTFDLDEEKVGDHQDMVRDIEITRENVGEDQEDQLRRGGRGVSRLLAYRKIRRRHSIESSASSDCFLSLTTCLVITPS